MTSPVKLTAAQRRALEAVATGAVHHAHPFAWAVEADWLDVKPRTLASLAGRALIRVDAGSRNYWRPVALTPAGRAALEAQDDR